MFCRLSDSFAKDWSQLPHKETSEGLCSARYFNCPSRKIAKSQAFKYGIIAKKMQMNFKFFYAHAKNLFDAYAVINNDALEDDGTEEDGNHSKHNSKNRNMTFETEPTETSTRSSSPLSICLGEPHKTKGIRYKLDDCNNSRRFEENTNRGLGTKTIRRWPRM